MPCWEGSRDIKMDCTSENANNDCCDPKQIDITNCHCDYDYAKLLLTFSQEMLQAMISAGESLCALLPFVK